MKNYFCLLCCLVMVPVPGLPQNVILDTSSFWRNHYVLKMPVIRVGDGIETIPTSEHRAQWTGFRLDSALKWLEYDMPYPDPNWKDPEFDDSAWGRFPGVIVAGGRNVDRKSPYMALKCVRGKFQVIDPASVGQLTLSLEYRGGVVVYINGREVHRSHLPEGRAINFSDLAEPYKPGEDRVRERSAITIPGSLLRKGTNVLGLEVHRAPYAETENITFSTGWLKTFRTQPATCGLESVRLSTDAPQTVVIPNIQRPDGFQVWNGNINASDFDLDYGDPNEPLRPIYIVGTRNGTFSGQVMVGSREPVSKLRATPSDLVSVQDNDRTLPASSIQIRYGMTNPYSGQVGREVRCGNTLSTVHGSVELDAQSRYLANASRFEGLNPDPPDEVPVHAISRGNNNLECPGVSVVPGAVVPVWATVRIPADAHPGNYEGKLEISAEGVEPVEVTVRLVVYPWALPGPRDFHTFVDIVQSPETLAIHYGEPLWSERHFKLVERSMELLSRAGNNVVYIPLIAETNLGNSDTMVRWIKQADGTYKHDFSIMDRYLDIVEKHLGKPAVVCFYVWDAFLGHTGRQVDTLYVGRAAQEARQKYIDALSGPEVSLSADNTEAKVELPRYEDPRSKALWAPLLAELKNRMQTRDLESAMMLGTMFDFRPDRATVEFFDELLPGTPWVGHAHQPIRNVHGFPMGYISRIYFPADWFSPDPSLRRLHGWNRTDLEAFCLRDLKDNHHLTFFRFLAEFCTVSNLRGMSRLGGDLWPVFENRQGRISGRLSWRYPKSSWGTVNIGNSLFEPGATGAISTVRYDLICEGIQETEARIFLEKAIIEDKVGGALAQKSRNILDERTRLINRSLTSYLQSGIGQGHTHFADPRRWAYCMIGYMWHAASDWQSYSEKLYSVSGEVAAFLGLAENADTEIIPYTAWRSETIK